MKVSKFVDDTIMTGVNQFVRAYNWSTGRTKADLANKMLTIAPILEGVGLLAINLPFGLGFTPVYLTLSHYNQKMNIKKEEKEKNALEGNSKVMVDEGDIFLGYMWSMIGTNQFFISEPGRIIGTGNISRGASHFIMRADYLPPRKNALSRLLDYVRQPALQTQEVTGNNYVSNGLEDFIQDS